MTRTIVAIDGTSGSGKSTVARIVAACLGLPHVDTGAMYRLVGVHAMERGVLEDAVASAAVAAEVMPRCDLAPDGALRHDRKAVGEEIRTPEASHASSIVAAHPEVRSVLVPYQRSLVPSGGAVVEGRDIGTVVWPDADVKAYLDARPEVRAQRRSDGRPGDAVSALDALRERDARDATRPVGAMRPAPDALLIDTSDLTPEEVADRIVQRATATRASRANAFYRVVRGLLSGLLRGPFRLKVEGADRIPAAGAAIIAPNHRSLVDIPLAGALTRRKVWLMAKEELFAKSWSASLIGRLGGFPVRRGRPDRKALQTAFELLAKGELVGIFPEGTRRPGARFEQIEEGLAYVALKSGAPIVPVAISGSESIFPPGRKLPRFVRLRALIGEPFTLGGPVTGVLPRSRIRAASAEAERRLRAVMDELEPPAHADRGRGGVDPTRPMEAT